MDEERLDKIETKRRMKMDEKEKLGEGKLDDERLEEIETKLDDRKRRKKMDVNKKLSENKKLDEWSGCN